MKILFTSLTSLSFSSSPLHPSLNTHKINARAPLCALADCNYQCVLSVVSFCSQCASVSHCWPLSAQMLFRFHHPFSLHRRSNSRLLLWQVQHKVRMPSAAHPSFLALRPSHMPLDTQHTHTHTNACLSTHISKWLQAGGTHIDTSCDYGSEPDIGNAVKVQLHPALRLAPLRPPAPHAHTRSRHARTSEPARPRASPAGRSF